MFYSCPKNITLHIPFFIKVCPYQITERVPKTSPFQHCFFFLPSAWQHTYIQPKKPAGKSMSQMTLFDTKHVLCFLCTAKWKQGGRLWGRAGVFNHSKRTRRGIQMLSLHSWWQVALRRGYVSSSNPSSSTLSGLPHLFPQDKPLSSLSQLEPSRPTCRSWTQG